MKKTTIILIILLNISVLAFSLPLSLKVADLHSPDGRYKVELFQHSDENGIRQLFYSVSFGDNPIILESELGVLIENNLFEKALGIPNDSSKNWSDNLSFVGSESKSVNESWTPVYGENSTVPDHYNEIVLKFEKNTSDAGEQTSGYDKRRYYHMNIVFRAYNEGVAFCYNFPEATNGLFLHITGEKTSFRLPEGTLAYHESWAQGPYTIRPLTDWDEESERPLTMKLPGDLFVSITEAGLVNYSRMKLRLDENTPNTIRSSLYSSVDVITPYATPWRVIMAAEKSTELIMNNHLILNLNAPNKIVNTDWIKPGKVIRVAPLTQKNAFECVDFAAERGMQYIHLDAGWYGPEMKMSSDATTVAVDKDFNMPALTAYAASKNIGVWVYVNQRALVQQLDTLLPLYKKWDIKGIKFGFVQVGNQHWTTWLHDAVAKCAAYGIMVDIHDEYRPTGISRTYPNLLTQEGVRGNEEMPDATHNTILPFTRFIAGAADYTICYYNNRIKTTHAHQLALSVVYYSPLQFLYWYDQPSSYQGEKEIEFFDNVKTVWDETVVVDGQIGEFITVARRSDDEWFVGSITNNDAREIKIPLGFLDKNLKYNVSVYQDDDQLHSRTKVSVSSQELNSTNTPVFHLKAGGGVALHFIPKEN